MRGSSLAGYIPIRQFPSGQVFDLAEGGDALYPADQIVPFHQLLQSCLSPGHQRRAWCECVVCARENKCPHVSEYLLVPLPLKPPPPFLTVHVCVRAYLCVCVRACARACVRV